MDAWESSNRKVTFPRVACDAIRKAGGSTLELQNYISQAMATPEDKRNKSMRDALVQYLTIKKECEMAIAEDAADSNQGAIFLLKATHGYEDKQTVRVEDGNLADVIAKKSQHKDD